MCGPHDNTNVTHVVLGDPQFDMPDLDSVAFKHPGIYRLVKAAIDAVTECDVRVDSCLTPTAHIPL